MKRTILALAVILASFQFAGAQGTVKTPAAAKSAVESAEADSQNEKKAAKFATWIKLATAYMDAYNAPAGNVYVGAGPTELALLLGTEKASSSENVTLNGQAYKKDVFKNKNLYFNEAGVLQIIEVTKPVVDNALGKSLDAWKKAYQLDVKKAKTEDIKKGMKTIVEKYQQQAYDAYTFGDLKKASKKFEQAFEASAVEPLSELDTTDLYNAGFTAHATGEFERAASLFEKCLDHDYAYTDGEVYAKLGDIYNKLNQADKAVKTLETGFAKYPASQSILVGLINYYITSGTDTDRLFTLLDAAKKNEPGNASLYYVEGNIRKELAAKMSENGADEAEIEAAREKAIASYQEANKVNAEYEWGYIGEGILRYETALDYQEKASATPDSEWQKYDDYMKKMEESLLSAAEPFEKAFALCKQDDVKQSLAEYLKNIYYRFASKGPEYKEKYDIYKNAFDSAK
ncbi:MAG: hypothetical protein HUJ94_07535 [Bacteroidales bacterium]|nr:hypothetical protein [Bacteroidales bacterium]